MTDIEPRERMCVWVDVYADKSFYTSIPVWFAVEAYEEVYVVNQHISYKQLADESYFSLEKRNIAKLQSKPLSHDVELREYVVKRVKLPGDVLLDRDVKPAPAIIEGQIVKVVAKEGNVSVEIKGIARRDAEVGELLKVKSLETDDLIKVKVVDNERVEVI